MLTLFRHIRHHEQFCLCQYNKQAHLNTRTLTPNPRNIWTPGAAKCRYTLACQQLTVSSFVVLLCCYADRYLQETLRRQNRVVYCHTLASNSARQLPRWFSSLQREASQSVTWHRTVPGTSAVYCVSRVHACLPKVCTMSELVRLQPQKKYRYSLWKFLFLCIFISRHFPHYRLARLYRLFGVSIWAPMAQSV